MARSASFLPLPPAHSPASQQHNDHLCELMRVGEDIQPGTLIACTSGSTGTPKGAMLSADNLRSSGAATAEYLAHTFDGAQPGAWLLALPPHHVAGLQVILRSTTAGYTPVVAQHLADPAQSFSATTFIEDTQRLRSAHPNADLYTSLVPAQLERISTDPAALDALRLYSAVLVGGAATRPELVDQLRLDGAHIALTYGSSESSGGAVYDGHPLPGVRVGVENKDKNHRGTVTLTGPMVARGYRNVPRSNAFPHPGTFVTTDLGTFDGTLRIHGRADGAINSGGYKILPEDVERALLSNIESVDLPDGTTGRITGACAGPIEHPEFGQAVGAVLECPVVASGPVIVSDAIRDILRPTIDRHIIPLKTVLVDELPTTGPGKLDRQKIAALMRGLE